ncbi:MAG TPA: sigma factor-like helix-turn-helix DNA-binding protein [Burkholderiales bacterium]|nr:sigma factor-like helix-turn-helix DNA-binding protein [Burkholderiales bacterium]
MPRRMLEKLIDALPDDYRAVFVLRVLEELTVEETTAALGPSLEEAFAFDGERCDRIVAKVLERIAAGT